MGHTVHLSHLPPRNHPSHRSSPFLPTGLVQKPTREISKAEARTGLQRRKSHSRWRWRLRRRVSAWSGEQEPLSTTSQRPRNRKSNRFAGLQTRRKSMNSSRIFFFLSFSPLLSISHFHFSLFLKTDQNIGAMVKDHLTKEC